MLEAPTFRVVLQAGSTAKGSRSKQEDAFCCQTIHIPPPAIAATPCSRISSATMDRHQMKQQQLPIENTQPQPIPDGIATHVIGVFDGHGGYSVSHLLSNIVPEYLCYILCQEASAPKETPTTQNDPKATPHDNSRELLTRAFKRVFYDVDDFILHWNHRDLSDLTNEILSLCMKASLRDPVAVNDFGNSCLPTAASRKNSCERSEDEEEEELERDTSGSPAPAMMMSFRSEEQPLGYRHSPQYPRGLTTDRAVGFGATGTPNTALRSHLQIRAGSTQGSNHKRGRELDQDENQENGESANQVSLYGVIRPATALCLSNYFADDSPLLADRTARTFATPTKKPGSNCLKLSPPPALTSQRTCINVRPLSPLIIRPLTTPTHVSRSPQQRSFLGNPLGFGQLNYSALKGGSSPTGSSSTGGGRRGISMGLSSATWEEETSRGTAPSISTSQQDQSGPRDTQNFYPSSSAIGLYREGGRNLSLALTTSPLVPVSRCTPVGVAPTLSGSQLRTYHQPRLSENVANEETAELIRVASQHPQTKVGSTASLCAITDTSIAIANVGDSRTIICELFIEDSHSPSSPTANSCVVRGRILKSTCDHRVSMISEKHRLSTIEHTADYQAWRSIRDGSLADAWWGASPLKPQQIVSWAANDDDVGEAAASHDVADNDRRLPVLGSIAMNNHLLGELGVSRSIGSFNLKVLKPQSQAVVQSQSSSSAVDSGSRHKSKNNRLLTKRKGLERAVDTCGRLQVDSALSPLSSVCDVTVLQADEFSQGLAMSESRSLLTSTNAAAEEASCSDGTAVKGRKLLMVLSGTDGLWDVGTNEEVLDVLLQHPFMISAVKSYLLVDPPLTSTPERTTTNTTGVCPTAATPTMKPASSRDSHLQQQPYFICSSVLPPASFALPESEGSLNNAASSPQLHPLIDSSRSSGGPQQSREWAFASEQLILSQNSSDSVAPLATSSPLIQAPSTPPVRPAVCVPANQHVLRDLPQMPNCRARSHPAGLSTPNGATQFSTPKKNPLDCGGGGSLQQAVDKLINWAIHTRHGSDNVTVTVSLISLEGGLQAPKQ